MVKLLSIFVFLFSSSVWAKVTEPVIQRYGIIGTNMSGSRLAVILTHFGPSSGAPFANLLVMEAGKSDPLLKDGRFMMEGGETELAQLASALLEKNRAALAGLGIDKSSPIYGDANFILESFETPIKGVMDIENVGIVKFRIESGKADHCSEPFTHMTVTLGSQTLSKEPNSSNECWAGPLQLRNIVRTKAAAWFFILKKGDALGAPFFEVNVLGLNW